MKRVLLALLLFSLGLVSAGPLVSFQHPSVQPGETLLAFINTSGEFAEKITPEQISFFEGRRNIYLEYDLAEHNGTYYLVFYPTREGNFSLKIMDIAFRDKGILQSSTLEKEFQVFLQEKIQGNITTTEVLSIKPGILKANQEKLTLLNKGTTNLSITLGENKTTLLPQESMILTPEKTPPFVWLSISTYKEFKIPLFAQENIPIPPDIKEPTLKSSSRFPKIVAVENTVHQEQIELYNFGDENITIINISSSQAWIIPEELGPIPPRGVVNFSIKFNHNESGHVEEKVVIRYESLGDNFTLIIPLDIYLLPQGSNTTTFESLEETCAALNGSICKPGQEVCAGDTKFTKGSEYCCLGTCKALETNPEGKKSSSAMTWGIIILIILALVGFLIYRRSKKAVQKSPEQHFKDTQTLYEKRLSGSYVKS